MEKSPFFQKGICIVIGFQRRRSRGSLASLLGRRGCFGRALRYSPGVQERLAKEPGLGILCRMPTEDPRAGPTLIGQPPKGKRFDVQKKRQLAAGLQVLCRTCTLLLHIKAPSFWGPAVAAKQTEVSCWLCRRLFPLSRPCGPGSVSSLQLTSAPWAAPSQGRSLLLSQLHVFV